MKPNEKQKMCPHCEGRVPVEAEICPFCAQEIGHVTAKASTTLFQSQALEDSLASLYKPPYQGRNEQVSLSGPSASPFAGAQSRLEKPEAFTTASKNMQHSLYGEEPQAEQKSSAEEKKSSLWPAALLLLGTNLFVLGLLQLFFATDGRVHLEWDATNWFFYCLAATPLFYFGWKKLKELD